MEAQVRAASVPSSKWEPSPDASHIVKRIHAMLHPRNIVLVGATDKPGNYAERIWNNLIKYKYAGGLYPINAKREQIWGVPCYKDFASLPEKPDHVLVLVPARFAVQVIRDAAAAGARSATIVTSGFSELQDEDSQRLAVELQQAVRETGMAVTGPNCLGNLSAGENYVHQYRRPHRHHGARTGGDRRPVRRHRDGDPPGTGGSRRRRRLYGHDRQRGRPRDARPDGLFRGRSVDQGHRGLSRGRAEHQGVPRCLQGRAGGGETCHCAEARRLRRRPCSRDGAYRCARGLHRNLRRDLHPRRRDPRARPRRADRDHRMLRPYRYAEGQPACLRDAVGRQAWTAARCLPLGGTEFRAAEEGRARQARKNAGAGLDRRQSARRRICRRGRSFRLHAVDQDHDRRSRHRHRHHRCRAAEGAARTARADSPHRQRDGGPRRQTRHLYQRDVDRFHRLHEGAAQVAA